MTEDEALRLFTIARPQSVWTLVDQRKPVSLQGALDRFDEYQAANPDAVVTLVRRVPALTEVKLFLPSGLLASNDSPLKIRRLYDRLRNLKSDATAAKLVLSVPAFVPFTRTTWDRLLAKIAQSSRHSP